LSLGGPKSAAVDAICAALFKAGITVVVAAGNSVTDACTTSPGGSPDVISVGASCGADNFAAFSNFGKCIKVIAPGCNIQSIDVKNLEVPVSYSGTSMSSPHVAGLALLIGTEMGITDPTAIAREIETLSQKGLISDVPADTPNRLANIALLNMEKPVISNPLATQNSPIMAY